MEMQSLGRWFMPKVGDTGSEVAAAAHEGLTHA